MQKILIVLLPALIFTLPSPAQDANLLIKKVKAKLDQVNDYIAEGSMKTDIAFIKAPAGKIKVFYKRPDKFKIKRNGGISILPKSGVSFNMGSVLSSSNFTTILTGEAAIARTKVKVVKLLPNDENTDIVLTTLFIDEANLLIRKANTTTRENGTFEIEMSYGKYAQYALPDKVIFAFNTKNYKIPKGVTMEFDTDDAPQKVPKNKKGKVEINYSSYIINKGFPDTEFK